MRYHVHVKNEAGRDDSVTVDAATADEAMRRAYHVHGEVADIVDAYPAGPAAQPTRSSDHEEALKAYTWLENLDRDDYPPVDGTRPHPGSPYVFRRAGWTIVDERQEAALARANEQMERDAAAGDPDAIRRKQYWDEIRREQRERATAAAEERAERDAASKTWDSWGGSSTARSDSPTLGW